MREKKRGVKQQAYYHKYEGKKKGGTCEGKNGKQSTFRGGQRAGEAATMARNGCALSTGSGEVDMGGLWLLEIRNKDLEGTCGWGT